MELGLIWRKYGWVLVVTMLAVGCVPDVAPNGADGTGASTEADDPGSTTSDDTGTFGESDTSDTSDTPGGSESSGGEEPIDAVPRLLAVVGTVEGGSALHAFDFTAEGVVDDALDPGLDPTRSLYHYVRLAETDYVAFRTRGDSDDYRLHLAQLDAEGVGSTVVLGDTTGAISPVAWVEAAQTLIYVDAQGVAQRREVTHAGPGEPVAIVGPAAADNIRTEPGGTFIASSVTDVPFARTCYVADVDPAAPRDWILAYDGPDTHCYLEGFGEGGALVFSTGGDAPPFTLWRRAIVDGELQPAVMLADPVEYLVHVGAHGVVYRAPSPIRTLHFVPIADGKIGASMPLTEPDVGVSDFTISDDGRYIFFAGSFADLAADVPEPVEIELPDPYRPAASSARVEPTGQYAWLMAYRGEYPDQHQSLWRIELSEPGAPDPLFVAEAGPAPRGANAGYLVEPVFAPDGSAIMFSGVDITLAANQSSSGDGVWWSELVEGTPSAPIRIDGSVSDSLAFSADGQLFAFGELTVHSRGGEDVLRQSATTWRWW